MSIKSTLARLQDELDSKQIFVRLTLTPSGVEILAKSEADRLIAKSELAKNGFTVSPLPPRELAQ